MKNLFTISLMSLCLAGIQSKAQTAFPTMDSVNINNINAAVLVHGDMWWNPATANPHCSFPNGSGKNISFVGALWMSGYDDGNNLHVAAQTYRQNGNDYWPGPLDGSDTLTYATSQNWAKIWKVNRTDIQAFQAAYAAGTATSTNTAAAIWEWPAKGNANAKGNGGVALTITDDMAPFVDLNGNGTYEPQLGEYPDVKGDQALWYVFSDKGPTHTESKGTALGVEIHAMAYAYKRGNSYDNMVFYDYSIKNKSSNNYHNFRIGQLADMDMGYFADDFIGCDTTRGMGIIYNGAASDAVYGTSIPMAGVIMRITGSGIGSFMYYNNDMSAYGNPTADTQYNNYLRSTFRDGSHTTDDYTAFGTSTTAHGAGPLTNYVFNGNPADHTQWSECSSGNTPGDRRFILASSDMALNAGATANATIMLVTTPPGANNACGDTGLNFNTIDGVADSAISVYDGGGLPVLPSGISNTTVNNSVSIFPNPAHDKLYIKYTGNNISEATITIYNSIGQVMHVPIVASGNTSEADVSKLPGGLYNVLYRQGSVQQSMKFIKE